MFAGEGESQARPIQMSLMEGKYQTLVLQELFSINIYLEDQHLLIQGFLGAPSFFPPSSYISQHKELKALFCACNDMKFLWKAFSKQ